MVHRRRRSVSWLLVISGISTSILLPANSFTLGTRPTAPSTTTLDSPYRISRGPRRHQAGTPLEGKRQHHRTRLSHPPSTSTNSNTRLSYSYFNDTRSSTVIPTVTVSYAVDEFPTVLASSGTAAAAVAVAIPPPSPLAKGIITRNIFDQQFVHQPRPETGYYYEDVHRQLQERYETSSKTIKASLIVGLATSLIGFAYSKVLNASVNRIWKWLPTMLMSQRLGGGSSSINPVHFITGVCTVGGLIMGILSSKLHSKSFTLADFILAFSSSPAKVEDLPLSPSSRSSHHAGDGVVGTVTSLLVQSLVTCAFGFSVGPEAPIICMGALVGAQMARNWFTTPTKYSASTEKSHLTKEQRKTTEILAYAGAAGAWTALMGMPIIGAIFVLELTRNSASLSDSAKEALSPAITATLASFAMLRMILAPQSSLGGSLHFGRALLRGGPIRAPTMLLTSLSTGLVGAMIGTVFHTMVRRIKRTVSNIQTNRGASMDDIGRPSWQRRNVAIKTLAGAAIGLLSSCYPQTLFWGTGSLQCVLDGQQTPFCATKHGLSALLTRTALVDPSVPFRGPGAAIQVGLAKLTSISLAAGAGFPGGIVFPLFFAAAPFAHAAFSLLSSLGVGVASTATTSSMMLPMVVMCLIASTAASVARTPLTATLVLSHCISAMTGLDILLPAMLVSSYSGVWFAQTLSKKSYYQYQESQN